MNQTPLNAMIQTALAESLVPSPPRFVGGEVIADQKRQAKEMILNGPTLATDFETTMSGKPMTTEPTSSAPSQLGSRVVTQSPIGPGQSFSIGRSRWATFPGPNKMLTRSNNTVGLHNQRGRTMLALARAFLLTVFALTILGGIASAQSVRSSSKTDSNTSYEGFSEAIHDIQLSTEESGQLTEVPVNLGQMVRKGDVIAQLEDGLELASVEVARMQASMEGELEAAKAAREMQAFRVEQLTRLHTEQMAGVDELRRAEVELAVANAKLRVASEQKALRQVELKRLTMQVERRKLRAPFDAVVAEKVLDVGSAVTPTNSVVMRLVRVDTLVGVFNVPAEKSFAMKPGLATQVYFRAARQTVDGVIDSISPVINGESGTVLVRVRIENRDGDLRPGDRCSMRVSPIQQVTQRKGNLNR